MAASLIDRIFSTNTAASFCPFLLAKTGATLKLMEIKIMSAYAQTLDKSSETQLMSFRKIFMKDAEVFCVDCSGSGDVKELHSKRSDVRKMTREILDTADKEQRKLNNDEKNAFDVCTSLLDDIQVAFDTKQERTLVTQEINGVSNSMTGSSSKCIEMWSDDKKRQLPLLAKEHKFADFVTRSGNEISSRDYFASLVGNKNIENRDMLAGTDIGGGFFTTPVHVAADFVDLLRAKNICIAAGARTIPLPDPVVRVCKADSDPTASWIGEGTLIPDSNMTISAIDFVTHKLCCMVKISRELLQDASNSGNVIMSAIATAMSSALDEACLIGNTAGTLRLFEDGHGLKFEIDPDMEISYVKDLSRSMSRGDVTNCSFGFSVAEGGDVWRKEPDGTWLRTIIKVDRLFDVSPVTYPAYVSTSCAVRSMLQKQNELETSKDEETYHFETHRRRLELELML